MKMKKLLATALAVVTMASMSTVGASASTKGWTLRHVSGSSGTNIDRYEVNFIATTSTRVISEKCTSYTSGTGSNGRIAKVRYWGYAMKANGTVIPGGFSSRYHESTQGTHNIQLSAQLQAAQKLRVVYVIEQPTSTPVDCNMVGNVTFYGD